MTDLVLFRRQQRLKRQLKKFKQQLEKLSSSLHVPPLQKIEQLNSALEQFKAYLYSHTHKDYLTKEQLPKPYEHPRKGVCPQKPRVHKHLAKHVVGLKIPNPYDFERLKEDHPKLKEPYLHPPKQHKHAGEDLTGKIKPQQIQRKGLNADMVDGKHAKDLVKRVYAGGGPHGGQHETGGGDKVHFADLEHTETDQTTHDNLTVTPHLSQAEKDKIHDRLHALGSALDHSDFNLTDKVLSFENGGQKYDVYTDSTGKFHIRKTGADEVFNLQRVYDDQPLEAYNPWWNAKLLKIDPEDLVFQIKNQNAFLFDLRQTGGAIYINLREPNAGKVNTFDVYMGDVDWEDPDTYLAFRIGRATFPAAPLAPAISSISWLPLGDNTYDLGGSFGGSNYRWKDLYLAGNIIATASPVVTFKSNAATGEITQSAPSEASEGSPLQDSPDHIFVGRYWDGISSIEREARLRHDLLAATPQSRFLFEIAGATVGGLRDDGSIDDGFIHASRHYSGSPDALALGSIGGQLVSAQHPADLGADLHHARSHDHSLVADGSPIAVAGVPDLPASKIASERFPMARLPDGALNYVIKGAGAGLDPAYGQVGHGELTGVTADQHHAKLHATTHEKGGVDVLGVTVGLKFGAEGATTTSTAYVTIADSDIAFNPALFKLKPTLYVKFIYHIKNSGAYYTYIRILRQNAGTPVAGSEKYGGYGGSWSILETGWIDWSAESGNESYQIQMKVTGDVGEYNSALMILSAVQL